MTLFRNNYMNPTERLTRRVQALAVQLDVPIAIDGLAGPATLRGLDAVTSALPSPVERYPELPGFVGSLRWLHREEGHRGVPYWPGGASGVTLDPGVDLGHQMLADVARWYGDNIARAVSHVLGVQGDAARQLLPINGVTVDAAQAEVLLPMVAADYWRAASDRFVGLLLGPPLAQTAILSIAYNRGPGNRHLSSLEALIAAGDWTGAAAKVRRMQQTRDDGIPARRRREAELLRWA